MNYYHDIITEKSWKMLQELRHLYRFILIGGWAVYLYTHGLKSRDIDFICDYEELQKLRDSYTLIKNDRLKKYEIHAGEFDIDIYVPFFSDFGIPVEVLQDMALSREGFTVLAAEPLLILKQKAYQDRKHSPKGEKDKLDIISLIQEAPFDFEKYKNLLHKYKCNDYKVQLREFFNTTREAPQLNLKEHSFSRLKKEVLSHL